MPDTASAATHLALFSLIRLHRPKPAFVVAEEASNTEMTIHHMPFSQTRRVYVDVVIVHHACQTHSLKCDPRKTARAFNILYDDDCFFPPFKCPWFFFFFQNKG